MNSIEWLSRLIAFDTTSINSNMELIDCAQAWFLKHNMITRFTRNPGEPKANLFATLPSHDGSVSGGIVLSGHTDVVPVDGQNWDTNPFDVLEKNGKIYGRGACDMKGFLAVALTLVPEFQRLKLSRPVHFALSYDEEIGCLGAPLIIADFQAAGIKPDACIVGEPTEMRPVIGNKGIQVFRVRVHGLAAHSSLTSQGCNAIEYAAQLICYIRKMADEMSRSGPFDKLHDVPYTSVTTNMIQGGIAHNIIPNLCEFFFEFRNLSEVKPKTIVDKINTYVCDELLPRMQREHENTRIEIDNIASVPCFESLDKTSFTQLVRSACGHQDKYKVAYGTEAGLFQNANIPTIICGPGSIEQAHRANEYVAIEQLQKCEVLLREVVGGV